MTMYNLPLKISREFEFVSNDPKYSTFYCCIYLSLLLFSLSLNRDKNARKENAFAKISGLNNSTRPIGRIEQYRQIDRLLRLLESAELHGSTARYLSADGSESIEKSNRSISTKTDTQSAITWYVSWTCRERTTHTHRTHTNSKRHRISKRKCNFHWAVGERLVIFYTDGEGSISCTTRCAIFRCSLARMTRPSW